MKFHQKITMIKMDYTEIISTYLKEKNNGDEVITLLKEQKKLGGERSPVLNNEY